MLTSGLSLTQAKAFLSPFLLQMLWVEFWGFPLVSGPKADFILKLWTVIRPGLLPAPSHLHHTHILPPHLMLISFSCCKTGWLATHREQLPLAQGACWLLATFTGRCARSRSLCRGGVSSLPPVGPTARLWEESWTVWCGDRVVGSGD